MKNLQFDTFLCKIHGIVAEIYANTPDIALARFIFPSPFMAIMSKYFMKIMINLAGNGHSL